jgi:hypothetical protein
MDDTVGATVSLAIEGGKVGGTAEVTAIVRQEVIGGEVCMRGSVNPKASVGFTRGFNDEAK